MSINATENHYITALQNRGYDPNTIVVGSHISRNDNTAISAFKSNKTIPQDIPLKSAATQSHSFQRLPLRMVVSQTVHRDSSRMAVSQSTQNISQTVVQLFQQRGKRKRINEFSHPNEVYSRSKKDKKLPSISTLLQEPYSKCRTSVTSSPCKSKNKVAETYGGIDSYGYNFFIENNSQSNNEPNITSDEIAFHRPPVVHNPCATRNLQPMHPTNHDNSELFLHTINNNWKTNNENSDTNGVTSFSTSKRYKKDEFIWNPQIRALSSKGSDISQAEKTCFLSSIPLSQDIFKEYSVAKRLFPENDVDKRTKCEFFFSMVQESCINNSGTHEPGYELNVDKTLEAKNTLTDKTVQNKKTRDIPIMDQEMKAWITDPDEETY